MKKFTKILSIFTLIAVMLSSFCLFGCDKDDGNNDSSWDGKAYTIYVYLEDGTTPVQGAKIALCFNKPDGTSQCLSPVRTDAEGKITISMADHDYVGEPVIHFAGGLPEGYGDPSDFAKVVMSDNSEYASAKKINGEVTKLTLTKN